MFIPFSSLDSGNLDLEFDKIPDFYLIFYCLQIICFLAVTFRSEDIVILDSEIESNSSENEVSDNIHSEEKSWKFQDFDVNSWNLTSQVNTFRLPDPINTDKYFR